MIPEREGRVVATVDAVDGLDCLACLGFFIFPVVRELKRN
jgi:hypothetical protein